ncbi:conserved Plasmodium protein, unknown function [Plasmodium reichenowi]|uniref:Uncharacterized protein n=1 Tax=Plasmodium reichenowi TaxID=5854 RepID=A0A060RNT0_PLARE|nr:conserved Plasmodium protein, unknown function [Plasmodium reichenowi]
MKKQKRIYDQSYIQLKEPLSSHNNILNSDEHDEKIKKKKKDERKINKHSYENISDSTNLSTNKYYINDSKKKEKKENNKIHKVIRHKIGMLFERIKKKTKRKKKEEKYTQRNNCNDDDNNNNNNNNNNKNNYYYYNRNKFYDYLPNIENIKIKNINKKHIKNIYNNTKDKLTKKRYQTTNHNTIHVNKYNENGMLLYNIKNILNLNNDDINNLIKISNFFMDLDMDTFYHTFINNNNNNNIINILNYNINHNKNIYDIKEYTNHKNEKVIQYKQNSSLYLGVNVCNISIAESSYFLYNKNVKYKYTPSHHVTNQNYFHNNKVTNINNLDYFKDKSKEQYSDINKQIKTHLYYQHPYDDSICFLSSCNKEHIITNKQDINNQQHDIKNELGKENHQNICFYKNYGTYYYHKKKYIYHRNNNPISTNFDLHNNKKKKNYEHNIDNHRKYKSTIIHFFKKKFLRIKKKKKETKKITKTRGDETIYIHKNIEQHKNYKKEYSDIYRNENINYEIKRDNHKYNNNKYNNNKYNNNKYNNNKYNNNKYNNNKYNNNKYNNNTYNNTCNNNIKKKLRFIINKLFLERSKEKKTNKSNIVQGQKHDLPYISNKYLDPKFNELYYIQMINVYNEPFSIYIKIYQIYIFSKKTKNIKHFVDNDICPNNIQPLTSNKEKTNVSIYVLIDIQNHFLKYIIKKKIITEIQHCLQNWEKYIITYIQKMRGIHNNNDDNYNNFISLSNVVIYKNNCDLIIQHIINKIKYYLNIYVIPFFHKILISITNYISVNYKNENLQYYFFHSSTKKKKIQLFIHKTKNKLKNTYNNIFCKEKNRNHNIQNKNNQTYLNKDLSYFFYPNKEKKYIYINKNKTNPHYQYYYTFYDLIYETPFYYLKSHKTVQNYIIYINSLYFRRLLLLYTFLLFFLLFLMIFNMPIYSYIKI